MKFSGKPIPYPTLPHKINSNFQNKKITAVAVIFSCFRLYTMTLNGRMR